MQETALDYEAIGWVTYEEYLRIERETGIRHEYVGGELYAMVGASRRHNEISLAIYTQLLPEAQRSGCRVYVEGVKLRVKKIVTYYPDVMVTCDPEDTDSHEVRKPCLAVEVISSSTERTDRREKVISYNNMPSVLTYLIVDQDLQRIVRYYRVGPGPEDWETEVHASGRIPLPCPETTLDIDALYASLSPSTP